MQIIADPKQIQSLAQTWKKSGPVAFVPTMGCLHEGHLALVKKAQSLGKKVIVSIFVNPLQFGQGEDFERYPRPFDADVTKLRELNVDALFAPTTSHLYPEGFETRVLVGKLADHLCGKSRPGHFNGVATVCLKLFSATLTDVAVFGEKDFQQVRILEQLVADFNLELEIVRHPIVREADGLALSSRNRYLSAEERQWALRISQALKAAREMAITRQAVSVGEIIQGVKTTLSEVPLVVDYLEVASEHRLSPIAHYESLQQIPLPRLFIAVKCGSTRLIDNLRLRESSS